MDKETIACDCSVTDICPQGVKGHGIRCRIWKNKEYKMTRDEAHGLAFNAAKHLEGKEINQIIKVIEVLGLIKFDDFNPIIEAKKYLSSGQGYRLDEVGMYNKIIKGLLEELDKRPKIGDEVTIDCGNSIFRHGKIIETK